jgi:hypothetical protein
MSLMGVVLSGSWLMGVASPVAGQLRLDEGAAVEQRLAQLVLDAAA